MSNPGSLYKMSECDIMALDQDYQATAVDSGVSCEETLSRIFVLF